jgi:hypothetical protein
MAISESARHDLYNGLAELLGAERAETMMTYLPSYDPTEVATQNSVVDMRSELKEEIRELRVEMRAGFDSLGKRIDRVLLTLVAGLFVIVASTIGLVGVVLGVI